MNAVKNILIADDDKDDIEFFEYLAKHACPDVNIHIAFDGIELLNKLTGKPRPDIIIMDLNMPRMGGRQCLNEVRSNVAFKNIPVIIMSTSNFKPDIDYCFANGANYYFVKSHAIEQLKDFITKVCEGSLDYQWIN